MAIGEEPAIADPLKAIGQDVKQEPAHELVRVERHGLFVNAGLVVFVREGHHPKIDSTNPTTAPYREAV